MRMTSKMMHISGSRSLMLVEESAMVLPFCQYPLLTLYPLPSFWSRAQALMSLEAECKSTSADTSLFIVSLATWWACQRPPALSRLLICSSSGLLPHLFCSWAVQGVSFGPTRIFKSSMNNAIATERFLTAIQKGQRDGQIFVWKGEKKHFWVFDWIRWGKK